MKPVLAYTFAIAIGVLITLKLLPASNDRETASEKTQKTQREKRGLSDSNDHSGNAPRFEKRQRPTERPKKVSDADFERWLASKQGDTRSLAEAQAIVGLLTENPDLIRQALEADPENPHLLYIGSTLSSFSKEERLWLGERFFKQDPENGLAGYLYAAQLFKSGDTKKGLKILTESQDRSRIDAYATQTQLLMDDAYITKGLSPSEAKIQSTLSLSIPYFSDLQSLADAIKDLGNSLPPNEAADLRTLSASMATAFAYPLLAPETSSGAFVIDFSTLIFTGFVFLGCALVSCFTGCMRIILSRSRDFLRPSLRAPMFSERSPVQFFWYSGILILSAGFGASVSNFTHTLSTGSVLMIAGGLGFLIGSLLTVKMNARRFISHENGKNDKA